MGQKSRRAACHTHGPGLGALRSGSGGVCKRFKTRAGALAVDRQGGGVGARGELADCHIGIAVVGAGSDLTPAGARKEGTHGSQESARLAESS